MDVLALVARLTLDKSQYENGLSEAESEASSAGGKLGKVLGGVGKAVGTAAKVTAAGISAGTAAVGVLAKQSVDAYANYEQLVGGVGTLFGDSAQKVLSDASEAFKTAGMSMNDYMDTSIQSAAALINSLGGDQAQAADLMNMSITDMADNVNKMGTSMEGVQNAYRGFSRGNFTMLDNLALGFAGTKEGMQELLDKAHELSGVEYNIDSYADIVQAIHVVQDEMGITGTTSKEAATTIEGSLNSVKGAWTNLVAGFANPDADMGKLMDDLVVALVGKNEGEGLLNNILPAVERALQGIGDFVVKAAPIISKRLPALMRSILPSLIKAATALFAGLVKALPSILQILIEQAPTIIEMLAQALMETAPLLVELGKNLMSSIYNGLVNAFPQLAGILETLKGIFQTVFDGISTAVGFVIENIDKILPVVAAIAGAIGALGILSFISGLVSAITGVAGAIGTVISALSMIKSFAGLVSVISTLAGGPLTLIVAAIGAVAAAFIYLWNTSDKFRNFWIGLWEGIKSTVSGAITTVKNIVKTTIAILASIFKSAVTILSVPWQFIWVNFGNIITDKFNAIKDFIANILDGIKQKISDIWNGIWNFLSPILDTIKGAFDTAWGKIKDTVGNALDSIKSGIEKLEEVKDTIAGIFGGVYDIIKDKLDAAWDFISGIVDKIKDAFDFDLSFPDISLPDIKMPHFSWSFKDVGFGISIPEITVDWWAKGYDNPFLLKRATVLQGFGDRGAYNGGEIVYSHDKLMDDIRQAVNFDSLMTFLAQVVDAINKIGDRISSSIASFTGSANTSEIASIFDPVIHNAKRLTDWEYWDWFSLLRDDSSANIRLKESFIKDFLPTFKDLVKDNNSGTTFAPVINVYGNGKSDREIADDIMNRLEQEYFNARGRW